MSLCDSSIRKESMKSVSFCVAAKLDDVIMYGCRGPKASLEMAQGHMRVEMRWRGTLGSQRRLYRA
jgi:hypothetical protein